MTESYDLNRSEPQVSPVRGYKRVNGPMRRSTIGGWTSEEDEDLTTAVQRYEGKNWKKIAECVPGWKGKRKDVQCQHRWLKVLDPTLCKGPWKKEEDDLLNKLVKDYMKNGKPQWSKISKQLPGRIGKQCRERWHNHLNPTIKKSPWTREEELILVQAQREHGNKWAETAKLLPGRTENNIKNHWNCSVKKRLEQFPSNLGGFEYNFFNQSNTMVASCITYQMKKAAKSPQRNSLELTLGPMNWSSTPSSTSSSLIRGDESVSSSVESDLSRLNESLETPQSSNDNHMCVQEVKEIKERLRRAASTFNTPSIISKRSSPASGLKRHRQKDDTPFQIDACPFSKDKLVKRDISDVGSKPLERRLEFDFM